MSGAPNLWRRHYRQFIYALVFLCVLLPMFFNVVCKVRVNDQTKGVFDAVEHLADMRHAAITNTEAQLAAARADTAKDTGLVARLDAHLARLRMNTNGVLLLSCDYAPDVGPELQPMSIAIMRHAFKNGAKVVLVSPCGPAAVQIALKDIDVATRQTTNWYSPRVEGRDYVFLGFRPGMFNLLMAMGENIASAYGTDNAGRKLETMPFMQGIRNYDDIELVVSVTGYVGVPETWLQVVKTKFKRPLGLGLTAVSVAEYYPYLQSGQIIGLLPGLRGAAEYETATGKPDIACRRMFSQVCSHLLVIALIVVGNIEFILARRAARSRHDA